MARNFQDAPSGDPRYPERKPDWLKVRLPSGKNYVQLRDLMRSKGLHTVCEEARCPNIAECWSNSTATFMILGDTCTRSCAFCAVTTGRPLAVDPFEPGKVARAVKQMGLSHVVVTSVDRDDLPDGGSTLFAQTIRAIRDVNPSARVEVLIPDFKGDAAALATVLEARPHILNHNVETVPRLYPSVRPQAKYPRSLELLRRARALGQGVLVKSGMMLGLGEEHEEIIATLADLRSAGTDIVTIGQYLRPSRRHHPLVRYYSPEEFAEYRRLAMAMGFGHVESGPLVRSSYHAHAQVPATTPG